MDNQSTTRSLHSVFKRSGADLVTTMTSVVERWNKTMKNRLWKMFTVNNNTVYFDKIDKLVNDYNNSKHSSVKMSPIEASKKKNEKKVWFNLYGESIYLKPDKPKFSVGKHVRISKYKRKVSF